MLLLTDFISGGQWFLPLIIICIVLGLAETYAKKKGNSKLQKTIDTLAYVLMLAMVIGFWILYFRGEFSFTNAAIYTVIFIYLIATQLLKQYGERLRKKWGKVAFHRINLALTIAYILLIAFLILAGAHFALVGWLIAGVLILIFERKIRTNYKKSRN
ncbi:hypothetical protein IMAU40088_01318 [Lactobacillus helveticus]|uniref:hypothetical protein n=1 Tax=Lactobacillus helveticus TaxID=1587 RepID=UPI0015626CD9|nr:hypothetical protein [Lactobacillus helveticus]NRO64645.1 hypothetical protein [Lactobacillus helveticus]